MIKAMNKNIQLSSRRSFIRIFLAGSFGIAIATVLGCKNDSVDTLAREKPRKDLILTPKNAPHKQPIETLTKQPIETLTKQPIETLTKQPIASSVSKPLESVESNAKKTLIESKAITREFKPKFAGPHYVGSLFDTHFHMPQFVPDQRISDMPLLNKDISKDELITYFSKENVIGVVGFSLPHPQRFQEYYAIANDFRENEIIQLFLGYMGPSPDLTESVIKMSRGLYKGFGELGFYTYPLKGTPLNDPQMGKLYKLMGKYKMPVMLHPDIGQADQARSMLKEHPNVNFLFHGNEIHYDIGNIINEFPNAYFSIDSAVLFTVMPRKQPLGGLFVYGPLNQFITTIENRYNEILNDNVSFWKPQIEQNPTKYMWGTDRFVQWHFTEEASLIFEEFARAFTGALPKQVQEMYAYTNANKLLKR
jgi:hypothetical protein